MHSRLTSLLAPVLLLAAAPAQYATWNRLTPTNAPTPRSSAAIVHDTARNRLVLFGGFDANRVHLSDLWEWDGANWTPRPTVSSPPGRSGFAFAYDPSRQRAVLFGGAADPYFPRNDTWEWDGSNWMLLQPPVSPAARTEHCMVFDGVRGKVLMFGGVSFSSITPTYFADTWEWDGATWTQLPTPTAPPARSEHAMVYDPVARQVLLHGGLQGSFARGDTWRWDGLNWAEVRSAAPWMFRNHHLIFAPPHGGVILLDAPNLLLQWTGSTWSQQSFANIPNPRTFFAAAYDPNTRRVLITGGYLPQNVYTDETWQLRKCLEASPDHIVLATGGSQVLEVDFGASGANKPYWILGSMTGTTPGTRLLNALLPLNLDLYTELALTLRNSAVFQRFAGRLGADGRATATLAMPPVPGFTGPLTLHHAAIWTEVSYVLVSNPAALELR